MKKWELEQFLQGVQGFKNPQIKLEQYMTPPDIAAQMLHMAQISYDAIASRDVCDLGSGTGMLTIGSIVLGARTVTCVECDDEAVERLRANVDRLNEQQSDDDDEEEDQLANVRVVHCTVEKLSEYEDEDIQRGGLFDTIVCNPPFGTRSRGADVRFVLAGMHLLKAGGQMFSLHKSSTRAYLKKRCSKVASSAEALCQVRYNLDASYKQHKKKSLDIDVDLWRIVK